MAEGKDDSFTKQPSSSRDVARLAGVSQSTVSRALRRDRRISAETQAKVSAAAERLGYSRVLYANSSAATHTLTVGVVVSDIQNPFYPELIDVLQTELGFLGIRALLFNLRTPSIMTPALMSLASQHSLDGLVLTSVSASWCLPERLRSGEIPTVLINRLTDESEIDSVSADNIDGGHQAADFLIGLGHREIGIVGGPLNISTHRDRRQGFMYQSSTAREVTLYEGPLPANEYSHATGFHSAQRILRDHPDVTALFCTNDLLAYGALSAARREGCSVPRDLSILGFDDIAMSSWDVLNLSTVHHPFKEMAKAASQRLADLMSGGDIGGPRQLQLPVHVVPRGSTSQGPGKVMN